MNAVVLIQLAFFVVAVIGVQYLVDADDYTVAEGNKSLLVALGCFWCAEQAFEQYGPGVVEAVSGYAGGENDDPTYRNHPGHYEVILIEYDPSKTSYEILVEYAYRNMDPFNGQGQFCDRGSSYYPAIFYETDEERDSAELVVQGIVDTYSWNEEDIQAPILERPIFWTAEDYHQNYYIKNPSKYGYYKNGCRRPQRLKEIWGEEEYECYHDASYSCFNETTVINSNNEVVEVELNIKNAPDEISGLLLPPWTIIVLSLLGGLILLALLHFIIRRYCSSNHTKKGEEQE